MKKLKIAVSIGNCDEASRQFILAALDDPAMLELCSPAVMEEDAAFRDLEAGRADALVFAGMTETTKHPAGAFEIIVTDKTNVVVLDKEPSAEDIIRLRDILERDFDIRSPRIAIVQESQMQNPDLASQITAEQGINTYGPYTLEQIMVEDAVWHFDGIVTTDKALAQKLVSQLSEKAPVRYFAGKETVVTAACLPAQMDEEEGLADVSWLTHPFFVAIDIIRNRAFYDEARQDILPKLFHDKREDRKKDEAPQGIPNNDNTEQAS